MAFKLNFLILSGCLSALGLLSAQSLVLDEKLIGGGAATVLIGVLVWIINMELKREKDLQNRLDQKEKDLQARLDAKDEQFLKHLETTIRSHEDFEDRQIKALENLASAVRAAPCLRTDSEEEFET